MVLGYGSFRLSSPEQPSGSISVAIIQPNIPQEVKWHKPAGAAIVAEHIALSEQAAMHKPDLIIWPETSHPDYLWEEKDLYAEIQSFVRRVKIPLLFGSVLLEDGAVSQQENARLRRRLAAWGHCSSPWPSASSAAPRCLGEGLAPLV